MKIRNILIVSIIPVLYLLGQYRIDPGKVRDIGLWKEIGENTRCGRYYRYNGSIYVMAILSDEETGYNPDFFEDSLFKIVEPVPDVDIESFRICQGTRYAMDKNSVYYPVDGYRISRNPNIELFRYVRIEDADRQSFKYIGDGYAIDNNNMYYNGKVTRWNNKVLGDAIKYYCR